MAQFINGFFFYDLETVSLPKRAKSDLFEFNDLLHRKITNRTVKKQPNHKNRYKLNGLRSESKRWNHPKGFHPFLYYVLHKRFRCLEKSELPFLNQNSIYSFYAPKNLKGAKPVYFDPHVCTSKHLLVFVCVCFIDTNYSVMHLLSPIFPINRRRLLDAISIYLGKALLFRVPSSRF